MDITERSEVYSEALQVVSMLASRQELIPMLLVPADGEVLAEFSGRSPAGPPSTLEGKNRKRHQSRGSREAVEGMQGQRSSKKAKIKAGAALATTEKKNKKKKKKSLNFPLRLV